MNTNASTYENEICQFLLLRFVPFMQTFFFSALLLLSLCSLRNSFQKSTDHTIRRNEVEFTGSERNEIKRKKTPPSEQTLNWLKFKLFFSVNFPYCVFVYLKCASGYTLQKHTFISVWFLLLVWPRPLVTVSNCIVCEQ